MEVDNGGATYEADGGKFTVTVQKVVPGQTFPNLDLISTLLVKRRTFQEPPSIIDTGTF